MGGQIVDLREYFQLISNGLEKNVLQKIKDERDRYIEGKPVDTKIIPLEIYKSWVRSQRNGVDPFGMNSFILDASRKKEKAAFEEWAQRYQSFFNCAAELIDEDEFSFSIGNNEGLRRLALNKIGLPFPSLVGECSEKTVGTTANCIAAAEKKPMVLLNPFYYRQEYHGQMNSAAALIHNEKKEIIGSISLAFYDMKQAQKAYWLITYLAKVFDSLYLPIQQGHEKKIKGILDLLPQGLAYIDEKNMVAHYNEKFLELMKVSNREDPQKRFSRNFAKLGLDSAAKKKEVQIEGKDVYVTCKNVGDGLDEKSRLVALEEKLSPNLWTSDNKKVTHLFTFQDIIGGSPALTQAKNIARNVARTSVPIMIFGENGTGKEMFAQAIHNASPRQAEPFIAINCGAIPAVLVESELFGYEEGSFTGALKGGKIGKIEAASGGTLFLDEIESMPVHDQIKLLRVLSTGKVQKVGSTKEVPVDIRLISATKKDLLKESDKGLFREDLFFRISTFIVELPALRERSEDIGLLAEHFIEKFSLKYGVPKIDMDGDFLRALETHYWRGNVRELEHAVERAVIMLNGGSTLLLEHLSTKIQDSYKYHSIERLVEDVMERYPKNQGILTLAEGLIIDYVLKSVDGNISAAAEKLGVTRKTIYNKIKEHPDLKIVR